MVSVGAAWAADAPSATPSASQFPLQPLSRVETLDLPRLDHAALSQEDGFRQSLDLPPRFAVPVKASVTPETDGLWEPIGASKLVWRYRVRAKAAYSLNFGFTRFDMPPGGRLLLYSADGREQRGPFTANDNNAHRQLWTPVMLASDVVIEVTIPAAQRAALDLQLGQVGQGYRGFGAASEKSGSCNMDVACMDPDDPWRITSQAVGVISTGGATYCSGSLVNNTAQDKRPFFMTAHHCGIDARNAPSLVVYWNYQNSTCRVPGSAASGNPGDGSLADYNTGAIFRATDAASDFTLVELDGPIDPAFGLYWAGWDRTPWQTPGGPGLGDFDCTPAAGPGDPPSTGACAAIHHPGTAEKRITFSTTPTTTTSLYGNLTPGDGTHIWVHWAEAPPYYPTVPGVTENGSSGAPLYNAEHRFIGQLHDGPSACGATGDNLSDYYGRFSVSWVGGGTRSTRLSDWLDPLGTGEIAIDGRGECNPIGGCGPKIFADGFESGDTSQWSYATPP